MSGGRGFDSDVGKDFFLIYDNLFRVKKMTEKVNIVRNRPVGMI